MKHITLALAFFTTLSCFAQSKSKKQHIKFKTDKQTGVKYCFIKHDKKAPTAKEGEYATVVMQYRNDKDSLVFDTHTSPNRRITDTVGIIMIPLKKSFNGCLEQAIEMMAVGDSAIFSISTDSLFYKTFHARNLPPYVHAGTFLTFYVKLVKCQTVDELKEEEQQQIVKHQMEMQQLKAEEAQSIAKYLSDNKINVQPTADSLFFLSKEAGNGKAIENGDSIFVDYTGMLLDGTVFDASSKHGGPLKMVYSPHMPLIKGWVLALATMREGDKARILLPSSLAYGGRQAGPFIKPFSPLIFDLQVVKVTPAHK